MQKFLSIFSISKIAHLPITAKSTLNSTRFTPLYNFAVRHNLSTIKFDFKLRDGTLKPI